MFVAKKTKLTQHFLGDSITNTISPQQVAAFVEKIYHRRDFAGFSGDRPFIDSAWAQRCFGKWRTAMAGVYAWRANNTEDPSERSRMRKAASGAYAQAFLIGPIIRSRLWLGQDAHRRPKNR